MRGNSTQRRDRCKKDCIGGVFSSFFWSGWPFPYLDLIHYLSGTRSPTSDPSGWDGRTDGCQLTDKTDHDRQFVIPDDTVAFGILPERRSEVGEALLGLEHQRLLQLQDGSCLQILTQGFCRLTAGEDTMVPIRDGKRLPVG